MSHIKTPPGNTCYFNIHKPQAFVDFVRTFRSYVMECNDSDKTLVFLCIGSDRATGDCLGPLIGHRLMSINRPFVVYGSLSEPVHAQNLNDTIENIRETIPHPYIVALDASLGIRQHVGYVTLGHGNLYPGIGVNKALPKVGDAFITGIVNALGGNSHITLQTTHLSVVMELSDFITDGIFKALS